MHNQLNKKNLHIYPLKHKRLT